MESLIHLKIINKGGIIMDEVYKPTIKKFLGKEVRVITVGLKQYIILKDMFDVLGRVKSDGT